MMNNKNVSKKTARMEFVEKAIRKSPLLPTMSFYQAKKYLNTLQDALIDPADDVKDNLKDQLAELCKILGVKESDVVQTVKESRLARTSLRCGVSDIPEYISLISEQLRYNISEESKAVIRQQLREAAFVTTY